jgi:hypothetical protein
MVLLPVFGHLRPPSVVMPGPGSTAQPDAPGVGLHHLCASGDLQVSPLAVQFIAINLVHNHLVALLESKDHPSHTDLPLVTVYPSQRGADDPVTGPSMPCEQRDQRNVFIVHERLDIASAVLLYRDLDHGQKGPGLSANDLTAYLLILQGPHTPLLSML